ncbi:MAG TPA: serine hydrolase [Actinomycetales bacterium]|nr:serine hydrolase [Actinomycetales bacterium]
MSPSPTPLASARAALVAVLSVFALLAGAPSHAATPPADLLDAQGVVVDGASPPPPTVTAPSWVVADLDSGDVLAATNAHARLAPASTLKLLTLLALAPGLDPADTYTATDADVAIDGSKVGIVPGSVYTVSDLLHGLMLASGNDAAHALAELSGGMPAATSRMQDLADELGAHDTVVVNTSGLDAEGQVSSAYDLAVIGRAVLEQPALAELVTAKTYEFPGIGTTHGPERPRFQIANHNRLLFTYPGTLGLKNGYTQAARGSFVAAVERDGRRYVVALTAAEGPTWRLARDLLDWAIAGGGDGTPVGSLDVPEPEEAATAAPGGGPDGEAVAVPHAAALTSAGAGGVRGWIVTPGVVLLSLGVLVLTLRTRAVRRRRRRRMARRRALQP